MAWEVAELMEQAGLTHGGLYNHFRSKDDLIAETFAMGLSDTLDEILDACRADCCDALENRAGRR